MCYETVEIKTIKSAEILISTVGTVRSVSKITGYSKSMVYNYLTIELLKLRPELVKTVNQIIAKNKS